MNLQKAAKTLLLGAALMCGIFAASAFQQQTDKLGIVDIAKVIEDSDYGKANQDAFKKMKAAREGVLEFIDQNRVLTNEQAVRIRDLSVKEALTAQEQTELDRLKADVVASSRKSAELQVKTNLTPEERTLLEDYARRSQVMEQVAQRWLQDFNREMQDWSDARKRASIEKAREAIHEVAKAQGYTLVLEVGVAPYGANDVTDLALKAMNDKK